MTPNSSTAIRLYGTEEEVTPPRVLRAGRLSAELDAGNLRHIRHDGVELIRAISFIVRDRNWGTYNPAITNLAIVEDASGFRVTYDAVADDDAQSFRFRAVIEGSEGRLRFHGVGEAAADLVINRTGFVVLHPIAGVAGLPVEIEHVDGQIVAGHFPEIIDPVQPMMDLRALTHEAAPGLRVACRMEGDTFEMEDQRNWTDASYQTYVRPLALPWPYALPAGSRLEQSVSLTVLGAPVAPAVAASGVTTLSLGAAAGAAPALGLGLDPEEIAATRDVIGLLSDLAPHHLICHHDPQRGHDRESLRQAVSVAEALGVRPWLEAVIVSVDGFENEIAELGAIVAEIGAPFDAVLLSPAPDLKCTLPGSDWPPAPPAPEMFRIARTAFPDARLGGGMFSFFTEMNRKRPPVHLLDLVSFTTAAMVHAGDDHSVMEGLESLPSIAISARAIADGRPFAVGPSAIGMRMNPYGEAPMANPLNIRQAMNRNDPRQRGLLGAAWAIGCYAHFARGGAEAVALGATTGPFGAVHTSQPWPTPGFSVAGEIYPVYHALRGLSRLSGRQMTGLEISEPSAVQGVCAQTDQGRELWLANLTPDRRRVALPAAARGVFVLDTKTFASAASNPGAADCLYPPLDASALWLDAFAIARMQID